ncbi:hypothetical protein AAW31_12905 [Nitrosomonas communis]|uniref:Uncharacterized protein n=1 Tax=Nitrosomonas communis TaxID=44574 RepID=A0A0F7KH86_9PROT|nr:hypothetical protein AAW31_12905 [Nitrosomonas communis]
MGWMGCACQQRKISFLSSFSPKCAEKHISSQQILNRNPIYPLEKGSLANLRLFLMLVQYPG